MSTFELRKLIDQLTTLEATCAADDQEQRIPQADVAQLLAAAARLYTACSAHPYDPVALRELALTPTDACTVAAALLRSQSLSPFEFSIWFSDGRLGAAS